MSYTLLIVDDETIDRNGIRHLVETEIPDITDIREASSGVDFIRQVEELSPDIVILDINMPGLDGLEALELIRGKGFAGKVIVHTAHGEFQYARNAVNLSADAYLLKPVKRKELLDLLRRMIQELNEGLRSIKEQEKLRLIVEELLPIVRSELTAAIVSGDISPQLLKSRLSSIGHEFGCGAMMTLRLPESFFQRTNSADAEQRAHVLETITTFMGNGKIGFAGMVVNRKIPILLFIPQVDNEFRRRIWTIEQSERLKDLIAETFSVSITVGIGSDTTDVMELHRSYRESLAALEMTSKEQRTHHFLDTSRPRDSFDASTVARRLAEGGLVKDYPDNQELIRLFQTDGDIERLKDRVMSVIFNLRRSLLVDEEETLTKGLGNRAVFTELDSARTEAQILSCFESCCKKIEQAKTREIEPRIHESVRKAQLFIEENYMKGISLDIVAESVCVSPYYLSHLFKAAIGQTYIGYLTDYRISRAEVLIAEDRYSLSEVASKCGYSNPGYFAKVFQKVKGISLVEKKGICRIVKDE